MPLTETDAQKYRRLRHQDSLIKRNRPLRSSLLRSRPRSLQRRLSVEDNLNTSPRTSNTTIRESNIDGLKMATSVCKELVSVTETEPIHFTICSHTSNENTTLRCGTKAECIDQSDCTHDHTILCKSCKKGVPSHVTCTKIINLQPGIEHPFVECGQTHILVDDEEIKGISYFCGQSITIDDFNTCSIKEHKVYCSMCQAKHLIGRGGLHRSLNHSTPLPKNNIGNDKDLITNQTINNIEEIQKSVKSAIYDDNDENNCHSNHHIFELRTRKFLSAPARKFMNAHRACLFHFSNSKKLISKQFGDEILQNLKDAMGELQKQRNFCLEPFTDEEIIENGYDSYINEKLDMYNEALQLHDAYFNAHIIEEESFLRTETGKVKASFQNSVKQPQLHASQVMTPPHKRLQTNINHINENLYKNTQSVMNRTLRNTDESPEVNIRNFKLKDELALIDKFDASQPRSYMAFRAQWTNFISKMNASQRSELDKYYALLSKLDGKAKSFIETKYPRNDSYLTAINKLDSLFYQPANLLRDMITNLMKTNKMVDNYDSLLTGMTNLWNAWGDLDHAELTNDQLKGLFFISATEKNLSEGSWKCWLDVQNNTSSNDPMAAFDIHSYMGAINLAMLNQQKKQNAIGYRALSSTSLGNNKSTLFGSYNMTSSTENKRENSPALENGLCIFCKGEPHSYQLVCKALQKMNRDEIFQKMRRYKIYCRLCLNRFHKTDECPAAKEGHIKPCKMKNKNGEVCGKYHCGFLCPLRKMKNLSNTTPSIEK